MKFNEPSTTIVTVMLRASSLLWRRQIERCRFNPRGDRAWLGIGRSNKNE